MPSINSRGFVGPNFVKFLEIVHLFLMITTPELKQRHLSRNEGQGRKMAPK